MPKQLLYDRQFLDSTMSFIEEASRIYLERRHFSSGVLPIKLLRSNSVKRSDAEELVSTLGPLTKDVCIIHTDRQSELDLILESEAEAAPWGSISFPYSHDKEVSFADFDGHIELTAESPEIKLIERYSGSPRFCNELMLHVSSSVEPMAEVIPEGSDEMLSALGRFQFREWRFSRNGPVFLAGRNNSTISLGLPLAEDTVKAWLREKGWDVALSNPGRIAKQMLIQLGGIFGILLIKDEGVLNLLHALKDHKDLPRQAVLGHLSGQISTQRRKNVAERILKTLLDAKALQLGTRVQCPVCLRRNWYDLATIDYQLDCEFCLSIFQAPVESPKDINWSYRSTGPFSVSVAQGAFTVLFLLQFLEEPGNAISPLFSYVGHKNGKTVEADLTCLYQEDAFRRREMRVINAECKSYNDFERVDIQRMAQLAEAFPYSFAIFATLKRELSHDEREMLQGFVADQCERQSSGEPYVSTIVLTGTELFSLNSFPYCWEELGGTFEQVSSELSGPRSLSSLADATQKLYLHRSEGEVAD